MKTVERPPDILPPVKHYPRYSATPFPLYRFVPGRHPHPTEDPRGHSFGLTPKSVEAFDPHAWQVCDRYLYGVDLYNYAYWWESHECFEGLWRPLPKGDPCRDYLQGLIKVSAAFLKWHLRRARGVTVHYAGAVEKLRRVARRRNAYMGLDLQRHLAQLDRHFAEVLSQPESWPDPVIDYPFLELGRSG